MRRVIGAFLLVKTMNIATLLLAVWLSISPLVMPDGEIYRPDQADVDMLARLVWTEARGVKSEAERAAVVWVVLNRVDSDRWPDTIAKVVTAKGQFAYSSRAPLKQEYQELATDVLIRWNAEKCGIEDVGRVLPKEYVFFAGKNGRNRFRTGRGGGYWDWSLDDPYD